MTSGRERGWRTSSYSNNSNNCVQIRPAPAGILIRNSRDPDGAVLQIDVEEFRALLLAVKAGELDHLLE